MWELIIGLWVKEAPLPVLLYSFPGFVTVWSSDRSPGLMGGVTTRLRSGPFEEGGLRGP